MGKGSGTSKTNVTKRPQRLSDSEAAGTGGASSGEVGSENSTNACLFQFTPVIEIDPKGPGLRTGQPVTLVQGKSTALDVMSGGAKVASFSGSEQALVEQCMAIGYVYKGVVRAVNGSNATCSVKGFGVQNGPANDTR
ncbi:TPA: hypothetical protein DCF80_03185 [Candidatus Saccharibacteria bacterium]|nr:hypothetical protein [Candidatus Saccharibacteria bacterium]HRK40455.1 hypothetical protein [Candidatus Saccharibacteria bacterium]